MRTRGKGGLNMTKNTYFVVRLIENATISEIFKVRLWWLGPVLQYSCKYVFFLLFCNIVIVIIHD